MKKIMTQVCSHNFCYLIMNRGGGYVTVYGPGTELACYKVGGPTLR